MLEALDGGVCASQAQCELCARARQEQGMRYSGRGAGQGDSRLSSRTTSFTDLRLDLTLLQQALLCLLEPLW